MAIEFIEREAGHVRQRVWDSKSKDERLFELRQALDLVVPFSKSLGKYRARRRRFDNRERQAWELKQKCLVCKEKGKRTHIHHIIPISKGGSNDKCNLVRVCYDCHCNIHGRDLDTGVEFAKPQQREKPKPLPLSVAGVRTYSLAELMS